jgi:PAS domain S-box-containing protein
MHRHARAAFGCDAPFPEIGTTAPVISSIADWLLDPSGLTPHGFCLLWEPWLIWTHVLSNIAIGLAYFSIPVVLVRFMRRRGDLVFKPVFGLFAAFILLCGAGHWADLLTLWWPLYRVEGAIKAATALVSVATAAALWPLLPRALALPSPARMREADAALRDSEERHRASFVGAPVPLHTLDAQGRITGVSDRWLGLMGYDRAEEVLGRRIGEVEEPASAARIAEAWERLLAEGEVRDLDRRFVRRDGAVLDVLVSARVERRGEAWWVVAAVTDVTERKRAEAALEAARAQLAQAQKMEAIGQLTGGVAHDFNNVLQAVTGNLELIRRRVRDERPDVARLAGNALAAAAKATGLTSQLLAFARRQRLDPKPLDPVEVVEGMRGLLARTAGERIALRVEVEEEAGFCLADRNQLESALLNLAINARDAIGAGAGTITVSVRAERVERAAEGGWPPEGDYVRIAVRDDGPGMPEEVRRRAFEPFFTTKAPGKGTGLGLAQIHGFAHQSGGTVMIDSAPGRGTEVAILLPRTGAAAPDGAGIGEAAEPEAEAGFGETVLVVEDDALVRGALAETLRDLHYRVVEAADADAALALLDRGTGVDAILSDVTMPGSMDGLGLAAAARARLPGVPVVLATGRAGALDGRSLPPGVGVLRKPLSRSAIAVALRRALAAAEEPEPVGA